MLQAANEAIDWSAAAGLGSIVASLATLAVVAYNGGRLTQKVSDLDDKHIEQGKTNVYFNEKISEHDRALSELKGIDLATRRHAD
jgi:hypothetical protein